MVNTDWKGRIFPIMLQQFVQAISVAIIGKKRAKREYNILQQGAPLKPIGHSIAGELKPWLKERR